MPSAVVLGVRNLGGAITRGLLDDGYRVASVARTKADLDRARGLRRGARARRTPPTRRRSPPRSPGRRSSSEPPDVLVNAVSLRPPDDAGPFGGGPLASAAPAAFDAWAVPAPRQTFLFLAAGARALAARGGTLVQVTGAPARRASSGRGLVAAGLAAVRALTHAAALEHRADGVQVKLLIVDGIIESPKTMRMTEGMARDALVRQDDVVAAVEYLASQSSRGVSHELVLTPARPDRWVP